LEAENVPEWMTEIAGICGLGCKCIAPGQEPVTITAPGQEPVTLLPPGQEPVTTLTTAGQEPVTIITLGCETTVQCSSMNGVCIWDAEDVPEWMTEIAGICGLDCKCIAPGQEPVTISVPGQEPVTMNPPGEEPVTLSTPGQEPVKLTTKGCAQTEMCTSSNGLCVGEHEMIPDWMIESFEKCYEGCKCISPGQQPVTFTTPGQESVTLPSAGQDAHHMNNHSTPITSMTTTSIAT